VIFLYLTDWQLAGFWPYTAIWNRSVETGAIHGGVTPSIPAKVPGSIHMDLLRAGLIEDPYYEMNSLLCEWVPQRWWMYRTSCVIPEDLRCKRIRLVFRGIDYKAHIFFNDMPKVVHEGMYTHVVLDVTQYVKFGEENVVQVVLESAPDEMGQIGYTRETFTQKARFTYKWDFGTRMIHLGLYDKVYFEAVGGAAIESSHIRYIDGKVTYAAEVDGEGGRLHAELFFNGEHVGSAEGESAGLLEIPVENPKLWYPNGYGEQPLYDLSVKLYDKSGELSDSREFKVGLRTLSYERCDGANDASLPYLVRVNGKRIYLKGVNITPLDHMYGAVTRERYDKMLRLAKDAGVNLIRVWGGGIIESEDFYDLCDRYGIMVWQEFIQSSSGIDNTPSEKPEFLKLIAATAETAVKEKRNHVSLTYWSGGNELFDPSDKWIPATFENKNLAMLKSIVDRLDPDRLMLPTSASGPLGSIDPSRPEDNHDVHGPWKYAGVEGHYKLYNTSPAQLHSEFGCDGMTNIEALRTILSPKNRKVTTMAENFVWRHHGEWWDTYEYREKPIFGELAEDELELFVMLSQYMQAEGIRYAVEANRRRAWQNCGSIIWQFNEPWPNVSCTCLVDYYMQPKFAYWFFRDALKSFHISMRYDKLVWREGEIFRGLPFVHDDTREDARGEGCKVTVRIHDSNKNVLATFDGDFEWKVEGTGRVFYVECSVTDGMRNDTSTYMFFVVDDEHPYADRQAVVDFIAEYKKCECK